MKKICAYLFLALLTFAAQAKDKTTTGFYYPTGTSAIDSQCGTWLGRDIAHGGCYFSGLYHIGVDIMTRSLSAKVYAVSDGIVVMKSSNGWGAGNKALLIRHYTKDGMPFIALYGHVRTSLNKGDTVAAGEVLGTTGPWPDGIHLHFGIAPGANVPKSPWGRLSNSRWPSTNGFTDPIAFLNSHSPYTKPKPQATSTTTQPVYNGEICSQKDVQVSWWKKVLQWIRQHIAPTTHACASSAQQVGYVEVSNQFLTYTPIVGHTPQHQEAVSIPLAQVDITPQQVRPLAPTGLLAKGTPPKKLVAKDSDLRLDFDIFRDTTEVSANCDNCSSKTLIAGERLKTVLRMQVANANVKDSLRNKHSKTIEGYVWCWVQDDNGDVVYQLPRIKESFGVDDLRKGDDPDEKDFRYKTR